MSPDGGKGGKGVGDARRAVLFMAAKFALFAVLPVVVAAIVVTFTLPE